MPEEACSVARADAFCHGNSLRPPYLLDGCWALFRLGTLGTAVLLKVEVFSGRMKGREVK